LWIIFLVARSEIKPCQNEDILNLHLKSAPLLHAVFLVFALNSANLGFECELFEEENVQYTKDLSAANLN
jgi:hypothetical protein